MQSRVGEPRPRISSVIADRAAGPARKGQGSEGSSREIGSQDFGAAVSETDEGAQGFLCENRAEQYLRAFGWRDPAIGGGHFVETVEAGPPAVKAHARQRRSARGTPKDQDSLRRNQPPGQRADPNRHVRIFGRRCKDPAIGIAIAQGPERRGDRGAGPRWTVRDFEKQVSHAGSGKIGCANERGICLSGNRHDGVEEPLLTSAADLGEDDLPAVSLDLDLGKHRPITRRRSS